MIKRIATLLIFFSNIIVCYAFLESGDYILTLYAEDDASIKRVQMDVSVTVDGDSLIANIKGNKDDGSENIEMTGKIVEEEIFLWRTRVTVMQTGNNPPKNIIGATYMLGSKSDNKKELVKGRYLIYYDFEKISSLDFILERPKQLNSLD